MARLLSTEALQYHPEIDDCHQQPPLGLPSRRAYDMR